MTLLGLGGGKSPDGELAVGFRRGWPNRFKLVLSSAGGAAVAFAAAELLEKQPREGFTLLLQWGPWPFIALVALALAGSIMSRLSETVQTTFEAVVKSSQQGAEAQGSIAGALTRLADQGGRQAQQVERLAIYAAQEFPSVYERFDKQDLALGELATLVRSIVIVQRGAGDK